MNEYINGFFVKEKDTKTRTEATPTLIRRNSLSMTAHKGYNIQHKRVSFDKH